MIRVLRDNFCRDRVVPVQTGALLWLACIYGVDVREHGDVRAALRKLAWEIVQNDPYAKNVAP